VCRKPARAVSIRRNLQRRRTFWRRGYFRLQSTKRDLVPEEPTLARCPHHPGCHHHLSLDVHVAAQSRLVSETPDVREFDT
jgi:hypothetical protein